VASGGLAGVLVYAGAALLLDLPALRWLAGALAKRE
jgi:hypothetical protein